MTYKEKYKESLNYIDGYWKKIIFKPSTMKLKYKNITIPMLFPDTRSTSSSFYIPHSFIVPNTEHFKRIYYWDTYFMFRGLMGTKRQTIMKDMVNNFIYLFHKFHIIPNFSAPASINHSQPPFFSSMIMDAYLTPLRTHKKHKYHIGLRNGIYKIGNIVWFRKAINIAKKEYQQVWIDVDNLYNHHVKGYILARYGDRDIGYGYSSELESGWDFTSRFYNRCDQFLPIDLNSYLYKYELDFADAARILRDENEEKKWTEKALHRKKEINTYMWDENNGFFYDYGYKYERLSNFLSLASFVPMWAGIPTIDQAKRMVKMLPKFETPYGLTITAKESLAKPIDITKIQKRYHPAIKDIVNPKQWDYPNIWSPLEYLTIIGLLRYGFIDDATRIMKNSLKAHHKLYMKYDTFFEKIDGETGESGRGALYGDQKGFGWTNAVFYRYVQILDAINSGHPIYREPKSPEPPFDLSILH